MVPLRVPKVKVKTDRYAANTNAAARPDRREFGHRRAPDSDFALVSKTRLRTRGRIAFRRVTRGERRMAWRGTLRPTAPMTRGYSRVSPTPSVIVTATLPATVRDDAGRLAARVTRS